MIAIVSDIHGNRAALAACLRDADAHGVTTLWCLGDVVGYGARPAECLAVLRERQATFIRGNHEQAVLDGPYGFNPLAAAAIVWTRRQVDTDDGETIGWMAALPERIDLPQATLVHGSPAHPIDEYLFPEDALDDSPGGQDYSPKLARSFKLIEKPCFVGHTHVPGVIRRDMPWASPGDCAGRFDTAREPCIVNAGSVGQPRDGDVRASYALFDGREVLFRRVPYDVDTSAREIFAVPELPDPLGQRLYEGW